MRRLETFRARDRDPDPSGETPAPAATSKKAPTRSSLAALCLVLPFVAAPAAASELQDLRQAWREADSVAAYSAVAIDLIRYRLEARYAKTAEIDYMIATSLCRIPGRVDAGRRHFTYILKNYPLGDDLQVVATEQGRCGQAEGPREIQFAMLSAHSGIAAEVRSKLYYWIGREDAPINTDPVEVVDPKTPEELLGRLFAPNQRVAALEAAESRVAGVRRAVATEHFVVVSLGGHSQSELNRIGETLEKFMAFYLDAYDLRRPPHLITVYLAPGVAAIRDLAENLHGLRIPEGSIGYTFRDDLSILGIIPTTAVGTLAHELFHLLVRDPYGDLPPWLDEGTAALYEVSNVSPKYLPGGEVDRGAMGVPVVGGELAVRGIPNWRGCVLRRLWLEDFGGMSVERPTVAELIGMDWQTFDNLEGDELAAQQAVIHATARYFVLYLQDVEQKLFPIFRDIATRDPFALTMPPAADVRQRVAAHLGDLGTVESRFDAWLRASLDGHSCE